MALVFRTIVVPAADVEAARLACATVEGGQGMFTAARTTNPSGLGAATHYINSGDVPEEILPLMWPSSADVSEESGQEAQTRLGLYQLYEEV